ncbi:S41 family peptidase [Patescibacteria group bacterium]|nr:S41 family peptidase [Patescibacteria group bacterium]MBU1705601.1 S41 family peptidase [Patescibacteria group bacterium]
MMDNQSNQSVVKMPWTVVILVTILFVVIAFASGIFLGRQQGIRSAMPAGEGRVLSQGDVPDFLADDVDFRMFWDVWHLVKEIYYEQPVSDKDLYYGAVKGMVAATDDPYTVFFEPQEAESFKSNLDGSFEGIGAEIGLRDDQLQIIAPLPGTPAEKAGLMPGDRILLIDETETAGMTIEEAVMLIRGEADTTVVLTITRDGLDDVLAVPIVRGKITIDSLKWEIDDELQIATISIYTFNGDTNRLFIDAINEISAGDVQGLILDLRSNPGGLLTTAVNVASAWTGYEPVVIEKGMGEEQVFKGTIAPRLASLPTVVLVNGGSASGSEIVAGALQDYGLATVVGTQTFGKGSVQDYRELTDGSAVKITIAQWLTPLGRGINKTGITPDIIVDYTLEDFNAQLDPQKDKAIEVIQHPEIIPAAGSAEETVE